VNLSAPFIRRPIATALLMVAVVALGVASYPLLPIAALPSIDTPILQVTAQLPGASPQIVADSVTTQLERQFGQVPGLSQMTSSSGVGYAQITLQFDRSRSLDGVSTDVQAAINNTQGQLPASLLDPPVSRRTNPADAPILLIAVRSDVLPITTVSDYADSILAQRIAQIAGVGQVLVGGLQLPALRVQLNPALMASEQLSFPEVRRALARLTVEQPTGQLYGRQQTFALTTNDQLLTAEGFDAAIVAYRDGAPIRIRDIGRTVKAPQDETLAGWIDGKPTVILAVQRQAGANVVETVASIRARLPHLRASLPPGIDVAIVSDRTTTIVESLDDVRRTLLLTIALVVGVIAVFLRTVWATVIPALSVPIALLGTVAALYPLGYSLDNLSLMGLSVAIGFVVDDAIVMVETVVRHIDEGAGPVEAAVAGASEIGFTVLSISISLIAVFIPLFLMGGVVGSMFREFAATVAVAILVSTAVSLTLIPMLCAKLLPPRRQDAPGRISRAVERMFDRLFALYDRGLAVVLRHQAVTLCVMIATILTTLGLFVVIPKGFFPEEDTGLILGIAEGAQDSSPAAMKAAQQALLAIAARDPAVASAVGFVGAGGPTVTENDGRVFITLKPFGQRDVSVFQVMRRLDTALASVPGITLYMQAAQDITIGGRLSKTQFQYTLTDLDPAELTVWGSRLADRLRALPVLRGVASDRQSAGRTLRLSIDRATASRLGVDPAEIDQTLYDAFGQRHVARLYTALNQYYVILEVEPSYQFGPEALRRIYVRSQSGTMVPIGEIATAVPDVTPLAINHQNQFPSMTLSFNLAPGVTIGTAVTAVEDAVAALRMPPSVAHGFEGNAKAFRAALGGMAPLILLALFAIYLILGMLYESTIHPITILSTLPSAGLGALLALMAFGRPLDLIGLIGIILLIGIVKKNGIMLVDVALEAERNRGLSATEAAREAGRLRFRPILMTTLCALLGGLPLLLATGAGAEIRQPLGLTIVGGLIVSQLLTLYTTPVVYIYMARLGHRLRRGSTGERPRVA